MCGCHSSRKQVQGGEEKEGGPGLRGERQRLGGPGPPSEEWGPLTSSSVWPEVL